MNEIARPPHWHDTTQAADGFPRLRWTLAEFERLSELGFFGGIDRERERLELVDGELLPMHAKGGRHEWVRGQLLLHLARALPREFSVYAEPGWRPGGARYLEPDMLLCPAGLKPAEVPPAKVLLLIEVAETSLAYDTGLKACIYATLGVGEYWVIDARDLTTRVHRQPADDLYQSIDLVPPERTLTPKLLPSLSLSLADLGLG